MLETLGLSEKESLSPRKRKSQKEGGAKLVTGKRAESIYKEPAQLQKALTKAGLEIQKQEAVKNLGPVLGKRLEQLKAQHAGGDEIARSARESRVADLKKERADEDRKQTERLRDKIASAKDEVELTEEDMIDVQEIPSGQMKTSEKSSIVSGEIISKDKLGRREYNKNVISGGLYRAAKYSDSKAAEEVSISKVENDRQRAKESRAEEAQTAYAQAYREYDPRFTKNKPDDLIAITRPPFFSLFSSAAKELKRLYGVMVKARENMASEDENKRIQENLGGREIKFKDSEVGLKPGTREALRWSNEAEERAAEIKRGKTDAEVDKI